MLGIYVLLTGFVLLVAYAGMEETVRLFAYIDLMIRYQWIKWKKWRISCPE